MCYYLLTSSGEQVGPYSLNDVRMFWNSNQITVNTLVWTEGMEGWEPLGIIEKLIRPTLPEVSTSIVPSEPSLPPTLSPVEVSIHEGNDNSCNSIDSARGLVSWGEGTPLIQGASASSTSKIVMGIEFLRRKNYEKALNSFDAALQETHAVASGWLGIAYAEGYMASTERDTVQNIRHAVNQANDFCPSQRKAISNHHGIILTLAIGKAAVLAGFAYLQSRQQVEEDLSYSGSAFDEATSFSSLVKDLIAEARQIYFECNPEVQAIIDEHIRSMSGQLTHIENWVDETNREPQDLCPPTRTSGHAINPSPIQRSVLPPLPQPIAPPPYASTSPDVAAKSALTGVAVGLAHHHLSRGRSPVSSVLWGLVAAQTMHQANGDTSAVIRRVALAAIRVFVFLVILFILAVVSLLVLAAIGNSMRPSSQ